jgi:tetratricopeptide (TPR) repeat protein
LGTGVNVIKFNFFFKQPFPLILLILLAGIIVYANTFGVPFVLDDHLVLTDNDIIKNLGYFLTSSAGYESSPTRFIGYLTFALNYHFGGLDVTGYHVVNLFIHLMSALLVYALLRLTFQTPYFQVQTSSPRISVHPQSSAESYADTPNPSFLTPYGFIPLFGALFFVVHPVQTQAVTYVVQRLASLATLFYLLSVVLYIKARLEMKESGGRSKELGVRRQKSEKKRQDSKEKKLSSLLTPHSLLYYVGSFLAAVLAMKTKEIAFTLPLAIVLYEVFFFRGPWKRRLLYLLPMLLTLPIVPVSVFATNGQLRAQSNISRLDYLFTQFRVIVTYLRLLVLPVNQNLDYDYPVYTTFFTIPVFLSFLLLILILALAVYLFFISRPASGSQQSSPGGDGPAIRIISFGILWFFLTLSVESSLIPIKDVIFEHRLYLPSVGAAAALTTAFLLLGKKVTRSAKSRLLVLGAAVLVLLLGFATYQRNHVWGNSMRLWEDVLAKSPNKARPHNDLAVALMGEGRVWEAIPLLRRALEIEPSYYFANYNLGRSYVLIGQSAAAIPLLQRTIKLKPDHDPAYNELGAALIMEGRYNDAISLLKGNLDRLGKRAEVHFNLGVAYFYSGNLQAAQGELAVLSKLDPDLASKLADLLP